jgi:hypothetical protein
MSRHYIVIWKKIWLGLFVKDAGTLLEGIKVGLVNFVLIAVNQIVAEEMMK